jgi:hypothetical protein
MRPEEPTWVIAPSEGYEATEITELDYEFVAAQLD